MNLYAGKVLVADLTNKTVSTEPLKDEWLKDYVGCWGLGLRYFYDLVKADVDPLSPENVIIIMTGPLTGTSTPLSARFAMVSKSPQTGTVFESNTGGAFAPELKFAGYDGIIIKGKADGLTYLKIDNDKVSLEDASEMAGKGIFDTEKLLKNAVDCQEAKTLSIGQAGENCVPYACVGTETYRQMGRGGGGAIFGSKNLKGIVCRGTGGIKVADMGKFLKSVRGYLETNVLSEDNLWAKTDGTPILMDVTNDMGIHPTKNFTYGINEDVAKINTDAMKEAKIGDRACATCVYACGKYTHIKGQEMEGPEYETLVLGGSNLGVNNLEAIIRFNRICDDMGLDTISCGSVIGVAMDMSEKGRKDFGLKFGDKEEYLKATEEIGLLSTERGKELAAGARALAKKYNSDDLTTEVKGMDFPAYDPRGNYGMGITYAMSERGACHMRAFTAFEEDAFNIDSMAQAVIDGQNGNTAKWSLGLCDVWATITPEIMADIMTIGLGKEVTPDELNMAGERIWNLTRLFNLKAGFTAADDRLPKKMTQALQSGPNDGKIFSDDDFAKAKKLFYQLRGWDESGVPSKEKLAELGLDQL
ncbi:MAG: aldehyde ferredoxin oxidoreductase family protein [Desulfobacterales bacterium]|nr:aldehyde ferredoxin oxidoreductase family protein [Desulfobacterales bacterium]